MKNRDVYQRDPDQIALLNQGVAAVTDAATEEERRTLRFELDHFVCEGQYRSGLVRILESYISHQGHPEQPAAWISGFFGSGKSHLAKVLRFLWVDYPFPDGARARGLARLPDNVRELLTELSTLGRREHGLHAAAGTLDGAGESVRLALLGIVFKSAGLPESFPQARFCLWLRKNGIHDRVRDPGRGRGPGVSPGAERPVREPGHRESPARRGSRFRRRREAGPGGVAGPVPEAGRHHHGRVRRRSSGHLGSRRGDALHRHRPRRSTAVHRGRHKAFLHRSELGRSLQQAVRRPAALRGHGPDSVVRNRCATASPRPLQDQRGVVRPGCRKR